MMTTAECATLNDTGAASLEPSLYLDEAIRDKNGDISYLLVIMLVKGFRAGQLRVDALAAEQLKAAEEVTAAVGAVTWGDYTNILTKASGLAKQ